MVHQQIGPFLSSRTDPELEVHSVNDDKMLLKHGIQVNVENTMLVSNVTSTTMSILKNNEDAKNLTSNRNGISIDAASGKTSRCNEYGYDVTDSEDCGDSKVDLGYHFTWSDEDEPSFLDQQGFGLNVYESIRAISKEASKKIDAVLAVDHVDQLQEELRKLRSEIKRRNDDFSNLKGIMHMKDHQIGTLELERDLYKADTTKLANDLETCLIKFRCVGGSSSLNPVLSVAKLEDETEENLESHVTNPPEPQKGVDESENCNPSVPIIPLTIPLKSKSHGTRNAIVQTISTFSPDTGTDTVSTTSNISLSTAQVNTPPQPSTTRPEVDQEQSVTYPTQCAYILDHDLPTEVTSQKPRRKTALMFAFCRNRTNSKKKTNSLMQPLTIGSCDSADHSQLIRKQITAVTKDKNSLTQEYVFQPHGILHSQIQDMDQRLRSSIKTSEDLRRRVAMLHLYYENYSDGGLVSSCVEKPNTQCHLTDQKSSFERLRSSTVSGLESQAHSKEEYTPSLRKLRVVSFNV